MTHTHAAFFSELPDAEEASPWYVVLVREYTVYGGPEEGGWWRHGQAVEAFKECPSKRLALSLKRKVEQRAAALTREARQRHGEQCLRDIEWLADRGLEDEFLPEPSGPDNYRVIVSQGIPQDSLEPGGYE